MSLKTIGTIAIPHAAGSEFDHAAFDAKSRRVFIAHTARDSVGDDARSMPGGFLLKIGPGHRAAVISLISDDPLAPATYKRRLGGLCDLSHVTIEVETCPHSAAPAA